MDVGEQPLMVSEVCGWLTDFQVLRYRSWFQNHKNWYRFKQVGLLLPFRLVCV
ncbi:unnamed protein product [Linum tenue]|uniref:Uncharacterized protein n=1 Tax=Linum tenue TaxID=586396 RepID=A0AAV0QQS3_9ROSI|nr:unnamed protein product [Linum tenue]